MKIPQVPRAVSGGLKGLGVAAGTILGGKRDLLYLEIKMTMPCGQGGQA